MFINRFQLRRGRTARYPDLTVWADPCVGCFRNENEAVWYFRKYHAGCIYTGIQGEVAIRYTCTALNDEENALYMAFRGNTSDDRSLPLLDIYPGTLGDNPQTIQYWRERALNAERRLKEITECVNRPELSEPRLVAG